MEHQNKVTRRSLLRTAAVLGVAGIATPERAQAAPKKDTTPPLTTAEMTAVEMAIGKKGRYVEAERVYTVPLPRGDLSVTIRDLPVPTPFGFGGWVSFKKTLDGQSAMLMSDTVLQQSEVGALMDAAYRNGLEVGAIHNHFFFEKPSIMYMHIHGMGSVNDLAHRYAETIRSSKLFPANQPPPSGVAAKTSKDIFDLPAIDTVVGYTGVVNGPTYKYTIGRDDLTIMAMGTVLTPAIGLNTWLSLTGTPDAAHAAGDVAMLEHEVNPVMRALRKANIEIVALHNHMLTEEPRIFFLHFYGTGQADTLARGFRAALDELGKPAAMRHG